VMICVFQKSPSSGVTAALKCGGPRRGELTVSVPPSMALKAAVYLAVREAGISNSEFARRMRIDGKEARRILDPHHPTKLARIEAALSVLGRHIELSLA
jgi:antitoxin HicB